MTVTVGQLIAAREAAQTLADVDLPVRAAYEVARLIQRLGTELQAYDGQRQTLFQKYGADRPAATEQERQIGATIRAIVPEHLDAFLDAQRELLAIPVEWPEPVTLTLGNGLLFKPRLLLALAPVLTVTVPEGS